MKLSCKECRGIGVVIPTKERGGPTCNSCGGAGYLTRQIFERGAASIMDHPSVFMGGPSQQNLRKAKSIADMLEEFGVEW